jgi:hypothetical protein
MCSFCVGCYALAELSRWFCYATIRRPVLFAVEGVDATRRIIMATVLEPRVNRLEYLMADLAENVTRLSIEMRVFKDEMAEFKEEMAEFKDEMAEFKDEMAEFKDEMREFKEESRRESREMNRRWGELSNKMGTLAEDLVAPSIPRILAEIAGCPDTEIELFSVRSRRRVLGVSREFDVLAGCRDILLINETKSRLNPNDVENFVKLLGEARSFLPEYAERRIVGALASFYVDSSLVRFGERQGLLMLGASDGIMELLNEQGFSPRFF